MSKNNSSSNSRETRQGSYQGKLQRDALPITPQNIKMPPVKPPKLSQPEGKSQQPESKK